MPGFHILSHFQLRNRVLLTEEVGQRRTNVSGEGLATEAATLIGKWVARGLSQSMLEAIRTQVFNVSAPTP